jgi:hypothetical protein
MRPFGTIKALAEGASGVTLKMLEVRDHAGVAGPMRADFARAFSAALYAF